MQFFSNKWVRRLLVIVPVILGVFVLLGHVDMAFAAVPPPPDPDPDGSIKQDMIEFFELALQTLHLLMWPLLAIAGASMDNSFIYGSIFYLDRALWKFWNIMRTFANFTIGFFFIWSILRYIVSQSGEVGRVAKVIGKLLVASILVNASWWIMAVMLDFSTLMTVNLGALPLIVVGQEQDEEKNKLRGARYLKLHSYFNLDSTANEELDQTQHAIVFSCGADETSAFTRYYIPCQFDQNKWIQKESAEGGYSWMSYKQSLVDSRGEIQDGQMLTMSNIDDYYCVEGYDLLENKFGQETTPENVLDARINGKDEMETMNCSTLDTIIERAQGLAGPMYTLFATIMHMGTNSLSTNSRSLTEAGLEFFIRTVVGIALIIPLFALAVVLIVRAILLWVLIAFSPLLFLLYVYNSGSEGGGKTFGQGKALMAQNYKNVLSLIFLPVYAVFAVSISIVFLSLFARIDLLDEDTSKDPAVNLGFEIVEEETDSDKICYDYIIEICTTKATRRAGSNIGNVISWLIINGFGIGLMWTVIFFALKSSKMTEGIATTIQKVSQDAVMAAPIIPMGGRNVSIAGIKGTKREMEGRMDERLSESGADNFVRRSFEKSDKIESTNTTRAESATSGTVNKDALQVADGTSIDDSKYSKSTLNDAMRAGAKSDGYKDDKVSVLGYQAANDLNHPDRWVKVKDGTATAKKYEYTTSKENEYKASSPSSNVFNKDGAGTRQSWYWVESDMQDGSKTSTISTFSYKDNEAQDVVNYKIGKSPASRDDWDSFSKLVQQADLDWDEFKGDTRVQSFFGEYISTVDTALANNNLQTTTTLGADTYDMTIVRDGNKVTGVSLNKITTSN